MAWEQIKTLVGEDVLKGSLIDKLFHAIKKTRPEVVKGVEADFENLMALRNSFAHELIIINPTDHPNDIFLSKILQKENVRWIDRKDGEEIEELHESFCFLYEKVKNELDAIASNVLKEREEDNKALDGVEMIAFLMESPSTGTAVAKEVFVNSPITLKHKQENTPGN